MRVLILNSHAYVSGGADRHAFDIATVLRAAGHEVAFLSTSAPQNLERAGAFVPLRLTNASRESLDSSSQLRVATNAVWNRAAYAATLRLVDEFRPDVVHSHKLYPHLSVSPIIAAARRGVPVVQTMHDFEFVSADIFDGAGKRVDTRESQPAFRALNTALFAVKRRWHVPAVSRWIAVSRAAAERYRHGGIDATPIANFTLTGTSAVPGYAERSGLFYAGRLTADKGIEDVITVAAGLPDVTVRIAGHGALEERVRAAAAALPNLSFLGTLTQAQVLDELRVSRVCLMPSRWEEPGPLASLEAMAAGTPLVAYRSGGLAEYVEDAGAGRVVAWDPAALARESAAITAEPGTWAQLSSAATSAIRGAHAPATYLASLESVYADAVADRASARAMSSGP